MLNTLYDEYLDVPCEPENPVDMYALYVLMGKNIVGHLNKKVLDVFPKPYSTFFKVLLKLNVSLKQLVEYAIMRMEMD